MSRPTGKCAKAGLAAAATMALALFAAAVTAADGKPEQATKLLGDYGDWRAFVRYRGNWKNCFIRSAATARDSTARGGGKGVAVLIHQPSTDKVNKFQYIPGYRFEAGSTVTLVLGATKFRLSEKGRLAQAYESQDAELAAALAAGDEIIIASRSSDSEATVDRFSLRGYARALAAINRACRVAEAE